MAWLRRIGRALCVRKTVPPDDVVEIYSDASRALVVIGPSERALVTSRALSARHRSLTIAAVDHKHIHWFDLGRARNGECLGEPAKPLAGVISRKAVGGAGTPDVTEAGTEAGTEAYLAPMALTPIRADDLMTAQESAADGQVTYESTRLLDWVLKLPCGNTGNGGPSIPLDDKPEWLGLVLGSVAFADIDIQKTIVRLARLVTRAPHLVSLYRFAAANGIIDDYNTYFCSALVRAMERLAESADPCEMAGLINHLTNAGMEPAWLEVAVESRAFELQHFARALIMGANAQAVFLDWLPTNTVLEATRFAMQHRQNLFLVFLAHTSLPPPLVRLVCELAYSLPDLAAEAVCVPVDRPGEILQTSAYPAASFTTAGTRLGPVPLGDGSTVYAQLGGGRAIFTYPDGKAAKVVLTVSPSGQETPNHRHIRDPADAEVISRVERWSSLDGLVVRDHLDSLFGDTHENRSFFVAERLRKTCQRAGDWAARSHEAYRLLARFGADVVASAIFQLDNDYDGPVLVEFGAMFAGVLALGVSPNHPRLCKLPWHKVKAALAAARSYQAADLLPSTSCIE